MYLDVAVVVKRSRRERVGLPCRSEEIGAQRGSTRVVQAVVERLFTVDDAVSPAGRSEAAVLLLGHCDNKQTGITRSNQVACVVPVHLQQVELTGQLVLEVTLVSQGRRRVVPCHIKQLDVLVRAAQSQERLVVRQGKARTQ